MKDLVLKRYTLEEKTPDHSQRVMIMAFNRGQAVEARRVGNRFVFAREDLLCGWETNWINNGQVQWWSPLPMRTVEKIEKLTIKDMGLNQIAEKYFDKVNFGIFCNLLKRKDNQSELIVHVIGPATSCDHKTPYKLIVNGEYEYPKTEEDLVRRIKEEIKENAN